MDRFQIETDACFILIFARVKARRKIMKKKAIVLGVLVTTLLLTASVTYLLVKLLQLNFIVAFLTVMGAFSSIIGTVMFVLREKVINGLIKLSRDKKERVLNNYIRQLKIYKFILWQSPLYVLVLLLIYHYTPYLLQNLQIETIINIVVIVIFYYLSVILNLPNKKFAVKKLKENLL
jgi:hypothetical protein